MIERADPVVLQVIHPACLRAITLQAFLLERDGDVRIEGLCLECDRYVHLRIAKAGFLEAGIDVRTTLMRGERPIELVVPVEAASLALKVREYERLALAHALTTCGGNMAAVSRQMGMNRATVYDRCRILGLLHLTQGAIARAAALELKLRG